MDAKLGAGMSRRELFCAGAAVTAGAATLTSCTTHVESAPLKPGATVLFQGDSITYTGRDRNKQEANTPEGLGHGYAAMAACHLLGAHPTLALQCHNRGVSGNKIPQLEERWAEDTIDLRPDVLSILIGVNDVWHRMMGAYEGTIESYESGYIALLERTHAELESTTFVVCEPFVLRTGVVESSWIPEFDACRAAAKRVAESVGAIWVPFQSMFDDVITESTPPEYWAQDGVHPTMAGHALMAQTWMEATGLVR